MKGMVRTDDLSIDLEEHELAALIYKATCQVPKGMVSTYGDIAAALGDIRASRAVGTVLSSNPNPFVVPCHRIVYSDGRVGWYFGKGNGGQKKEEILRSEGIEITDGRVKDLHSVRFKDFNIEPVLKRMSERQEALRSRLLTNDDFLGPRGFVGLDVSYEGDEAFAACVFQDATSGRIMERITRRGHASFPYVPTYLTYRELPLFKDLIVPHSSDAVYLVDGQGVLHPRRFGIACHLGVVFDVPTVGVAKSLLVGRVEDEEAEESPITLEGDILGMMIRLPGRRPLYVSVGHRVSLASAVVMVRKAVSSRENDPLREAHVLANSERRKEMLGR